jgi:hypothetical protein
MKIYWRKLKPEEVIEEGDYYGAFANLVYSSGAIHKMLYEEVLQWAVGNKAQDYGPTWNIYRPEAVLEPIAFRPDNTERKLEPNL